MSNENRALKPDAQAFDRIEIITVPRYKTSGLSGDEWRICANVIFYRKGREVGRRLCKNIESACTLLGYFHIDEAENGHAFFAGEGDLCDQEGCSNLATVRADKRFRYCREGHKTELFIPEYRLFCDEHKRRGDCGLDDADSNYVYSPY